MSDFVVNILVNRVYNISGFKLALISFSKQITFYLPFVSSSLLREGIIPASWFLPDKFLAILGNATGPTLLSSVESVESVSIVE